MKIAGEKWRWGYGFIGTVLPVSHHRIELRKPPSIMPGDLSPLMAILCGDKSEVNPISFVFVL